ncbi:hypothetical protein ScPMuIL_015489 [Solemya velum]
MFISSPSPSRDLHSFLEGNEFNRYLLENVPRPFEIIFPKQIRRNEIIGVSTKEHRIRHHGTHEHYRHVTIQLMIDGKMHKLRLEKNDALLSSGIKVKHFVGKNQQVISKTVEHCYYHGHVKRDEWSSVAISTCHGVRGVIQLHNETYIIHPLLGGDEGLEHPHLVYKATVSETEKCGNSMGTWLPFHELHKGDFIRKLKYLKAVQSQGQTTQHQEMKLKLALVFDTTVYNQVNLSDVELANYIIQTANIIDLYYKELKIRTALVYVEYWNLSPLMEVSQKVRKTLENFMSYAERELKNVDYHSAQFISTIDYENDAVGMAIPDSVCTDRAFGVSKNPNILEPQHIATILAHMIGHNLGIKHDEDGSQKCDDAFGCIMSTDVLANQGLHSRMFSTSSLEDLDVAVNMGILDCLSGNNQPNFPQMCGNAHVERGEECDCGSPEDCLRSDPCCDPNTCLLKYWADCRSGTCCNNCTFVSRDHICRESSTDCDVPEFCTGSGAECPSNNYIQDGHPCRNQTGYCLGGICPTLAQQCQVIWGKDSKNADIQCFERFNPTGNFNGHCGKDENTGSFAKCLPENIECGLLHCEGGEKIPRFGTDKAFSKTTVFSNGKEYECKIVHGPVVMDIPNTGLVHDGTRCGDGKICMGTSCTSISHLPPLRCPATTGSIICSGHGVCTKEGTCFCNHGWGGLDCSVVVNVTRFIIKTTTTAVTSTKEFEAILMQHIDASFHETTTHITPMAIVKVDHDELSTEGLFTILGSVLGGLLLVVLLTFFCYRRQSPSKAGKKKSSCFGGDDKKDDSCGTDNDSRLIKFGSLPSYRAEKLFGKKKKKKHQASEDESDIGELPPPPVIISNSDAAKPERGILKNGLKLIDERRSSESNTGGSDINEESVGHYTCDDTDDAEIQDILGDSEGRNSLETLDTLPESTSFDFMLPQYNFSSSLHAGNRSPSPPRMFSGYDLSLNINSPQRPFLWRTNLPSPPKSKILHLRNLDDLMQQIERHTIDLSPSPDEPPVQISPSTSEDIRSSSTEDRPYFPSHTPQSPQSITSGSTLCTKDTVRPFLNNQWSKYILRPNDSDAASGNELENDIEKSASKISIPPPMNPLNPIRSILNYGTLGRDSNDTPLGSRTDDCCSSNNGTANSRNGCEKSSGYGSEHDPERFSIDDLSRTQSRSGSISPPSYSAVIRTGPNQIKLVSAKQLQNQGMRYGSDENLQKFLDGMPRIDAGTFERSPLQSKLPTSTALPPSQQHNSPLTSKPELPPGPFPDPCPLSNKSESIDINGSAPCIDRSLEEIPQVFVDNKKKHRNSFKKSKRPVSLSIFHKDNSSSSDSNSEALLNKRYSSVEQQEVCQS